MTAAERLETFANALRAEPALAGWMPSIDLALGSVYAGVTEADHVAALLDALSHAWLDTATQPTQEATDA